MIRKNHLLFILCFITFSLFAQSGDEMADVQFDDGSLRIEGGTIKMFINMEVQSSGHWDYLRDADIDVAVDGGNFQPFAFIGKQNGIYAPDSYANYYKHSGTEFMVEAWGHPNQYTRVYFANSDNEVENDLAGARVSEEYSNAARAHVHRIMVFADVNDIPRFHNAKTIQFRIRGRFLKDYLHDTANEQILTVNQKLSSVFDIAPDSQPELGNEEVQVVFENNNVNSASGNVTVHVNLEHFDNFTHYDHIQDFDLDYSLNDGQSWVGFAYARHQSLKRSVNPWATRISLDDDARIKDNYYLFFNNSDNEVGEGLVTYELYDFQNGQGIYGNRLAIKIPVQQIQRLSDVQNIKWRVRGSLYDIYNGDSNAVAISDELSENFAITEENSNGQDEINFSATFSPDEGATHLVMRLEKRDEAAYDHIACLELKKIVKDPKGNVVQDEVIGYLNHKAGILGCYDLFSDAASSGDIRGVTGDYYSYGLKHENLIATPYGGNYWVESNGDAYFVVRDFIEQKDYNNSIQYYVHGTYYERDLDGSGEKAPFNWSDNQSEPFIPKEAIDIPSIDLNEVAVSELSNCQIDISWDAPDASYGTVDTKNVVGVYRNNNLIAYVDAFNGDNGYTDTNVVAGEVYNYQIALLYNREFEGKPVAPLSGIKSSSKAAKIDLLAAPSGLTSTQVGCNGNIDIAWNYSTNPARFIIERKTEDSEFTVLDANIQGSERSYIDQNVEENLVYYYRVVAVADALSCDAVGEYSATLTHSKDPIDIRPIFDAATYTVEVSKGYFNNRTELEWKPNLDTEQYINQYKIYTREFGSTVKPKLLTTLDINAKRFDHTDGKAGTMYEYFIIGERVVETECGRQITSSFAIDGLKDAATPHDLGSGVAYGVGLRVATGVINGNITYTGGIAVPNVKIVAERQEANKGKSLYFNGTDAYAEVTFDDKLYSEKAITLSAWIKPEVLEKYSVVLDRQVSYGVQLSQEGQAVFYVKDQNGTAFDVLSPKGSFTAGNWTNVTGTFDIVTQELIIYINGKKSNSKILSGVTNIFKGGDHFPFVIGRQHASEAYYFQGYVDEVRLYNRALTDDEVAKNSGKFIASDAEGLQAYWKIFEGLGNSVYDLAHKGDEFYKNDAVLYNTLFSDDIPTATQLGNAGYTDAYGNYTIEAVEYGGVGENFNIIPTATLAGAVHEFNPSRKTLFIGEGSKVNNDKDFEDVSSFQFSGHVRYDFANELNGEEKSAGVAGISIFIDGKTPITTGNNALFQTKEDGFFDIQVPIGNHYVEFRKNGHTFIENRFPAEATHDFQEAITGLQIFDSTTHILSGKVAGGLVEAAKNLGMPENPGRNNIGQAEFTLTSEDGKIVRTVQTDNTTGEYSIALPPKKYTASSVRWIQDSQAIVSSGDIQAIDLASFSSYSGMHETDSVFVADQFERIDSTFYNMRKDFIYRTAPELQVTTVDGLGAELSGEEYYELDQGSVIQNIELRNLPFPTYNTRRDYQLKMKAVEIYTNKDTNEQDVVGVSDGQLTINNGIGFGFYLDEQGKEKGYGTPEVLSLDASGELLYNFRTDYPNINHNDSNGFEHLSFTKEMSVSLTVGDVSTYWPNPSDSNETFKAYVIGAKSIGSNFVTESPATVDMVLRDPPGSNSYAYWEKGTTSTITNEFYLGGFGSVDAFVGVGAHLSTDAGTPFFTVGVEAHLVAGVGVRAEFEAGGGEERTYETTLSETIETNSDPIQVGRSDVYVAKSQNLLTGMAIAVKPLPESLWASGITFGDVMTDLDGNKYKMGRAEQTFVNPVGVPTYFNYSENHIVNVLLPDLVQIRNSLFLAPNSRYVSKLNPDHPNYGSNNDDPVWGENVSTDNYIRTEAGDFDGLSYTYTPDGDPETAIDSVRAVNQQIRLWKEALANNEIEKWKAIKYGVKEDNISFSSGNTLSKSVTTSESFYHYGSFEASAAIRSEVHAHFYGGGATEADLVAEIGFKASGKFGDGHETSITTGYVLQDGDEDDALSVNVYKGGNGNGPIFQTLAGQTSCPFEDKVVMEHTSLQYLQTLIDIVEKDLDKTKEESFAFGLTGKTVEKVKKDSEASQVELDLGQLKELKKAIQAGEVVLSNATLQRDKPKLKINGTKTAQAFNVPADEAANFNLTLLNEGEAGDPQYFAIKAMDETNPNGLEMTIDGQSINTDREFLVQGNGGINKVLKVRRGPNHYDYENVGVVIKSTCQADPTGNDAVLADTIYFSAKFLPVCTPIEISTPQNNWTWNNSYQNEFPITVTGYDVNTVGFEQIKLQYKEASSSEWTLLTTYYRNDEVKLELGGDEAAPLLPTSGNSFTYKWKIGKEFIDGAYDIRAISDCALAETTSEIFSGIIDRKRPGRFGAPQPSDGILSAGEEASIQFTEAINNNLLSVANFDVRGVLNGGEVRHDASIAFDGSESTFVKAELVNLESKPFTIEFYAKKEANNKEQILIAQGSDPATEMLVGFNASDRFYFSLAGRKVTAQQVMDNKWHHYAVSYDPLRADLTIYIDAQMDITDNSFVVLNKLKEDLYFGKSNLQTANPFTGKIHEVRIWSKPLTIGQVNISSTTRMVGNEAGLLYNWEFEEAYGNLAHDKVRGKHALMNANWVAEPQGYALQLSGSGNQAETQSVAFDDLSDFTFEFWFRSEGGTNETLLSNGKGDGTDDNPSGWSVRIDGSGKISVESNGNAMYSAAQLNDNLWHHLAVVVNAQGNASLFIDAEEQDELSATELSGFGGSKLTLGKRVWYEGTNEYQDQKFTGSIDELRIWNAARTLDQIERDRFHNLSGEEPALVAYYPFESYSENGFGVMEVVKNTENHSESASAATVEVVLDGGQLTQVTPVIKLKRPVEVVNISYAVNNDKVIISLNADPQKIENVMLDFTVSNVKDLNGNTIESPITWSAYIDKNQVVWQDAFFNLQTENGMELQFETNIFNNSGESKTFEISNIPSWLTVSPTSGTVGPLTTVPVSFKVSGDTNNGKYIEDILLTTDFGFAEKMNVSVAVKQAPPSNWFVNPEAYEYSMNVVGQISFDGILSRDEGNILAAFVGDECRGLVNLRHVSTFDNYQAFLSIYSNQAVGETLEFKIWEASTGVVHSGITHDIGQDTFSGDAFAGTSADPKTFSTTNIIAGAIEVPAGWKWISFNLEGADLNTTNGLFENLNPENNDVIKTRVNVSDGNGGFSQSALFDKYASSAETWYGSITNNGAFDTGVLYKVKISNPGILRYEGSPVNPINHELNLVSGWNYIGYTGSQKIEINEGLSNLTATAGDLIKNQFYSAIYDANYGWIGNLTVLSPNDGYMLHTTAQTFKYPAFNSSTGSKNGGNNKGIKTPWLSKANQYSENMTLVAHVLEQDATEGILGAFVNGECRGFGAAVYNPVLDENVYLVTLGGEVQDEEVTFKFVNSEAGATYNVVESERYHDNTVVGSIDKPVELTLSEEIVATSVGLEVYPNPFSDKLTVAIVLEESSEVSLELFDNSNRLMQTKNAGVLEKGRQNILLENNKLAAGLYYLVIRVQDEVFVEKVVVAPNN